MRSSCGGSERASAPVFASGSLSGPVRVCTTRLATVVVNVGDPGARRGLVRAVEAERLDSIGHVLLADNSATGGALSSHRVALASGADGAVPHRHDQASELFFILSGQLDVLAGDDVITTAAGDLLVVPPGLAHAFGAHRGSAAEALIVITPGIERFDWPATGPAPVSASRHEPCRPVD